MPSDRTAQVGHIAIISQIWDENTIVVGNNSLLFKSFGSVKGGAKIICDVRISIHMKEKSKT